MMGDKTEGCIFTVHDEAGNTAFCDRAVGERGILCPEHAALSAKYHAAAQTLMANADGTALNSMAHPVTAPLDDDADLAATAVETVEGPDIAPAAFRGAVIAGLRERGWPEPRSQGRNGEFLVPCLVWGQGRYPVVWLAESGLVIGYETPDDQESAHIEFDEGVLSARVIEAIDRLRWVIGLSAAQATGAWPNTSTLPPVGEVAGVRRAVHNMGVDPDGPPAALPTKPAPRQDPPFVPRKIGEF